MEVSHTVYLKVCFFLCPCFNVAVFHRAMHVCAFNGPTFTDLSVSTGYTEESAATGRKQEGRNECGRGREEARRGEARRQGQKKNTKSDKGEGK